ncbi:hypothetical protein [Microvirga terrestris]|uniref:Secreted protein n=1 Tax=Microvirga terrestris TaxID=2791024 RepID=A0ABS0HXD1_9HYPH|nr:hypothetical protein [Microvirga terrestris]MBF9198143.1 hypothetical protein [Microvirga terrestris]
MTRIALIAGAGLMALSGIGTAVAQPVSGTPNSPFPYAAPHEIAWINGMPCRTMYDYGSKTRIPVACATPRGIVSVSPMGMPGADITATGSIAPTPVGPMMGAPVSGTPGSPFPYAAPHEIRTINGVPCRTVYDYGSKTRIPVACAQ